MFPEIKNGMCQLGTNGPKTFMQNILRFLSIGIFNVMPHGYFTFSHPYYHIKLKQQYDVRARLTTKDESNILLVQDWAIRD